MTRADVLTLAWASAAVAEIEALRGLRAASEEVRQEPPIEGVDRKESS